MSCKFQVASFNAAGLLACQEAVPTFQDAKLLFV